MRDVRAGHIAHLSRVAILSPAACCFKAIVYIFIRVSSVALPSPGRLPTIAGSVPGDLNGLRLTSTAMELLAEPALRGVAATAACSAVAAADCWGAALLAGVATPLLSAAAAAGVKGGDAEAFGCAAAIVSAARSGGSSDVRLAIGGHRRVGVLGSSAGGRSRVSLATKSAISFISEPWITLLLPVPFSRSDWINRVWSSMVRRSLVILLVACQTDAVLGTMAAAKVAAQKNSHIGSTERDKRAERATEGHQAPGTRQGKTASGMSKYT